MKRWYLLHPKKKKVRYCMDCKKKIFPYNKSIRCNHCAAIYRIKQNPEKYKQISISNLPKQVKGKNNGNYKHGLSHTKEYKQKINLKTKLKKYNLSPKKFNELLKKQNNVCAICKKSESSKNQYKIRKLSVDHNHKTGKIRGLLCNNCNHALGLIKENTSILRTMIDYLQRTNK